MKYAAAFSIIVASLALTACQRDVVVTPAATPAPAVIAVPGPAGATGATGAAGETGQVGSTGSTGSTGS
ncbi:MAG: hypothetical protein K0S48_2144, partial [Ramlibacter sp.]|nr:hypothetical protein [Ramlibacter sp.]